MDADGKSGNAVAEARKLAAEGYREIVVNGIEISSWGWEWKNGSRLSALLLAICQAAPEVRIRLGSLEPRTIDEDFCKTLSVCKNLCPQFHLSLQSGSDTVLKRMNRKYDTARYLESVRLLHRYFPGCAITTDLIVGFPGETEQEFSQSVSFLQTCELAAVHVFPYSRRKGTPAASMPDQIEKSEKERRAALAGNRPPCRRHGWAGSHFRIRSVPGSVRSAHLRAVELRAPAAYRGGVVVESDGADARQLRQNRPFPRILGRLRVGGGKRLAQPSTARRIGAQSQSSHQSRPIQLAIRHELRLHMEHRRA